MAYSTWHGLVTTQAYPQLQATVVDLPTVTPITSKLVAEAGATARHCPGECLGATNYDTLRVCIADTTELVSGGPS